MSDKQKTISVSIADVSDVKAKMMRGSHPSKRDKEVMSALTILLVDTGLVESVDHLHPLEIVDLAIKHWEYGCPEPGCKDHGPATLSIEIPDVKLN